METNKADRMSENAEGEITKDLSTAKFLMSELISEGKDSTGSLNELLTVLNSPSFNCVKNVFETLYMSFSAKMDPEDSLISASKGTVAAFLACQRAAVRDVYIDQSEDGLGFNVLGGKEQNTPIFISKIIEGGMAEECKAIIRGDKLLKINHQNVADMKHEEVVEMLKSAKGTVLLTVQYCPDELERIEKQFGIDKTPK